MRDDSKEMSEKLIAFIDRYSHEGDFSTQREEEEFNRLAQDLFHFQFKHNGTYRKFCQARRRTPLSVRHWSEIPPVPIQAFKQVVLASEPVEEAEAVFMTSGTTDPEAKGRHYHPSLQVWDASMAPPFKQYVLPDRDKITMFVISPAENLNRHSSLSRYLSLAVKLYGTENSRLLFEEDGLRMERLAEALKECEQSGDAVLLLGATFAYVHFLDYCRENELRFTLPQGSRIFDTGGFKGRSREIETEELSRLFFERFHVGKDFCVNMYGMTELSSQFYDQNLSAALTGDSAAHQPMQYEKRGPAWIRTTVLHTDTLDVVESGQTGVLAHYDLANWNSCFAVLTEDLGYKTEHGFVLLGRVKGSEAKGCSIAVDQLMRANEVKQ